jgi:hypothetical protein
MILAPVMLNYIKVEASRLPPPDGVPETSAANTEKRFS